jgi:hypothetical protein
MQEDIIINKVASSGLITLDLEQYYHTGERVVYDIAQNLFHGLILKEKDFREFLKQHDWSQYRGKNVAIICSADAIVPTWALICYSLRIWNLLLTCLYLVTWKRLRMHFLGKLYPESM